MFCPKCGKHLPDGVLFCTECGADISSVISAVNNSASAEQDLPQSVSASPENAAPVHPSDPGLAAPPQAFPPAQPNAAGTVCPVCGNPVAEGAAFCKTCGNPIGVPRSVGTKKNGQFPLKYIIAPASILAVAVIVVALIFAFAKPFDVLPPDSGAPGFSQGSGNQSGGNQGGGNQGGGSQGGGQQGSNTKPPQPVKYTGDKTGTEFTVPQTKNYASILLDDYVTTYPAYMSEFSSYNSDIYLHISLTGSAFVDVSFHLDIDAAPLQEGKVYNTRDLKNQMNNVSISGIYTPNYIDSILDPDSFDDMMLKILDIDEANNTMTFYFYAKSHVKTKSHVYEGVALVDTEL